MDDGWICGNCHSINNARAKSCYSCHQPREQEMFAPTAAKAPDDEFPSSRAIVNPADIEGVLPPVLSAPQAVPPTSVQSPLPNADAPGIEQPPRFCASCGARLPSSAEFCPSCGHHTRVDSLDSASAPSASSPSSESPLLPAALKSKGRFPVRALILGAFIVAGVAAVTFVLTNGAPGSTYALTGYLNLAQQQGTGYSNYTIPTGSDTACEGLGGYSDIQAGAQLVVKDEAGKVIGSGALDQGHLDLDLFGAGSVCAFPFEIAGLPKAAQYQVGMGNRGSITYSFADLETKEWDVKLTLGS